MPPLSIRLRPTCLLSARVSGSAALTATATDRGTGVRYGCTFHRAVSTGTRTYQHPLGLGTNRRTLLLRESSPSSRAAMSTTPTQEEDGKEGGDPDSVKGKGQRSLPALFVRSGTSTGLVLKASDLPPLSSMDKWRDILPAAMGSPDPIYRRQLDGMGGGISSTSKVCVLAPSSSSSRGKEGRGGEGHEKEREEEEAEADVHFTFVQVGIRDGELDLAGNCGNMSAVVGPVAWDWGFVPETERQGRVRVVEKKGEGAKEGAKEGRERGERVMEAMVKVFNTNTNKIIHSRFRVSGNPPRYDPSGDYGMDGVPGTQSRITLSFINPAGAKTGRALPTGNPIDTLDLPDGSQIRASLVDVSNPGVFVTLEDLGLSGHVSPDTFTPATVEADEKLKGRLEMIRREGARRMGLNPDVQSVPKIVLLFPQSEANVEEGVDLRCLAMSMGQAHKAVPLTLSLCLGAAANIEGTVAATVCRNRDKNKKGEERGDEGKDRKKAEESRSVVIAHPSGTVEIGATFRDGVIVSADLHRTARILMKGEVYY